MMKTFYAKHTQQKGVCILCISSKHPMICSSFVYSFCSKADMSRLRLAAGCAMLKLAQVPAYNDLISMEQFQMLALMINVSIHVLHSDNTIGDIFSSFQL